jgi:hypothetical protein
MTHTSRHQSLQHSLTSIFTPLRWLQCSFSEDDEKHFLPRVYCYFDDTISDGLGAFGDFTGERLAIGQFNENQQLR